MRITPEQIDAIIDAFQTLNIDENAAPLSINVESLQKNFNAQINPLLNAANLSDEDRALIQKLLLIDEYQTNSADGMYFFFNLFGDTIGIFGLGNEGDNFKVLRLCFTVPDNQREAQTLNLVFHAFTKVLSPEFDDVEFINALQANPAVTGNGVTFSMTQEGNLITVTALAE
ncbi:MAG: hypothetical protein IJ685_02445 [Selenomonadaceae bacterium]|nr:hypothetical protein [Selenomonadaceae bacterium]